MLWSMESSSALPSDWNSFLSEAVAKPQDSHVNFAMSYIAKDSSHVLTIFWPQLYIRLEAETNYIKMSWKTVRTYMYIRIYLNFFAAAGPRRLALVENVSRDFEFAQRVG